MNTVVAVLGICLAAGQTQATQGSARKFRSNEEEAPIYSSFTGAQQRGDLVQAKFILQHQMLADDPDNVGYNIRAAWLSFEMGDIGEAETFYDKVRKYFDTRHEQPLHVTAIQCYGIFLDAARDKKKADWSRLPNRDVELNPRAILEGQCQMAIAEYYFRTARLFLTELKSVGEPAETLAILQRSIDSRAADQHKKKTKE
jgi:hypothetical protein